MRDRFLRYTAQCTILLRATLVTLACSSGNNCGHPVESHTNRSVFWLHHSSDTCQNKKREQIIWQTGRIRNPMNQVCVCIRISDVPIKVHRKNRQPQPNRILRRLQVIFKCGLGRAYAKKTLWLPSVPLSRNITSRNDELTSL